MPQQYRLDTRQLSLRECFSFGILRAPIYLWGKILRINLADNRPVAADMTEFKFVSMEELPDQVRDRFVPVQEESERLGAVPCFSYQSEALENVTFVLVFVSPDRAFTVEHVWASDENAEKVTTILASPRDLHGDVATTNQKRIFDPEAKDLVQYLPGASLEKLFRIHISRIERLAVRPVPVEAEEIREWIIGRERMAFAEFLRRGLFVPLG